MDPKLKGVPYVRVRVKRLAGLEQSVLTKIRTGELAQTKNDGDDYENEGEVKRIIDVREKDGVIE